MFGCKHKYGDVKEGYQYCKKCGKAICAPENSCIHKWEEIRRLEINNPYGSIPLGDIYVLKCNKCGEIKKVKITVGD